MFKMWVECVLLCALCPIESSLFDMQQNDRVRFIAIPDTDGVCIFMFVSCMHSNITIVGWLLCLMQYFPTWGKFLDSKGKIG